jgi:hypothetical protein
MRIYLRVSRIMLDRDWIWRRGDTRHTPAVVLQARCTP